MYYIKSNHYIKELLLTAILIAVTMAVKAQKIDTIKGMTADTLVFMRVEHEPVFPGNWGKFLSKNLHYPFDGMTDIQGKAFVQFIIEKDGTLSHIRVIKSLSPEADREALRVVTLSPKWKPGIQNGHVVCTYYIVPINFTIN